MNNLRKIITFSFFIVATSLVLAPFLLVGKKAPINTVTEN